MILRFEKRHNRTYLFQSRVVGVPRDDWHPEEAGHLEQVLGGRRRTPELLRVGEVDQGGAAVAHIGAQQVCNV